jgi:hypothetical protein
MRERQKFGQLELPFGGERVNAGQTSGNVDSHYVMSCHCLSARPSCEALMRQK